MSKLKNGIFDVKFDFGDLILSDVIDFQNPVYSEILGFEPRFIKFESSINSCPNIINFRILRYLNNELYNIWNITAKCFINDNILIYKPLAEIPPELELIQLNPEIKNITKLNNYNYKRTCLN